MESKLQRRIIVDLADRGIYALKVSLCNKMGHPDLSCFTNKGKCFFVEVKDIKGHADPLQIHRHQELERLGFKVHVISSWEEYQEKVWTS